MLGVRLTVLRALGRIVMSGVRHGADMSRTLGDAMAHVFQNLLVEDVQVRRAGVCVCARVRDGG